MNTQQRIQELEKANEMWQQWYLNQQQKVVIPQVSTTISQQPKKKKKAHKPPNKSEPISKEVQMWIIIIILSLFAGLIVKNWYRDAVTIPRKEVRGK